MSLELGHQSSPKHVCFLAKLNVFPYGKLIFIHCVVRSDAMGDLFTFWSTKKSLWHTSDEFCTRTIPAASSITIPEGQLSLLWQFFSFCHVWSNWIVFSSRRMHPVTCPDCLVYSAMTVHQYLLSPRINIHFPYMSLRTRAHTYWPCSCLLHYHY